MQIEPKNLRLVALVTTFSLSIAALCLGLSNTNTSKKLGTVDMQHLLSEQSQKLAKAYPSGTVPSGVMQQVVEEIKAVVASFGQEQKLTLLAKGAVLSGELPDYTETFKEILNETASKTVTVRGNK
ncbi:MAG: hypothetical protein WCN27_01125 [Alphaproteobacteria bacterium]